MDYMLIGEVSREFNVSAQTIRNWEESGLIGSERTIGGHRRYDRSEIVKMVSENKKPIQSMGSILNEKLRRLTIEQSQQEDIDSLLVGYSGDFTLEEMNCLLYRNFDLVTDELIESFGGTVSKSYKTELRKKYFQLLDSFVVTKLIHCQAMLSQTELVRYVRNSSAKSCIEMETVVLATHKSKSLSELKNEIESEIVSNLSNNAGLIANFSKLNDCNVLKIVDSIRQKFDGPFAEKLKIKDFWILTPPECKYECDIKGIAHYKNSRLLPSNRALIGFKNDEQTSYVFMPFCLVIPTQAYGDIFSAMYSSKLLRSGSKAFACINLE